jgi:hypothetical protein
MSAKGTLNFYGMSGLWNIRAEVSLAKVGVSNVS